MTLVTVKALLFSTLLVLSHSLSAVEYHLPRPYSQLEQADLQRQLPAQQIKMLHAKESEFLSLYSEYMSAEFRGVVVLIPDWQKSPTNNEGINFLRTRLNDIGYTTYALTVPDINWQATSPDAAKKPEATPAQSAMPANNETSNADNTTATPASHFAPAIVSVTDAVLDDYKSQLIARYEAVYEMAKAESKNIIVVAQGASAGALIEYYANFPATEITAFISLSSYLPNAKRDQGLNQTTSLLSPALLDIFYSHDNADIKERQRWVQRNSKFDYRQRELFGLRYQPEQQQRLIKEIDGFLRRLF